MKILTMTEEAYADAAACSIYSHLELRDTRKVAFLKSEVAKIIDDVKQACGVATDAPKRTPLPRICFECKGTGKVRVGQHWYSTGHDIKCDYCKGTGKLNF